MNLCSPVSVLWASNMMRLLLCAAIVVVSSGQATAIDIWLSASGSLTPGSTVPSNAGTVPTFHRFASQLEGSLFVWARPDSGKTLKNWSLRLTSSDSSILTFATSPDQAIANMEATANIKVYNDKLNGNVRWQHSVGLGGDDSKIDLFGISLSNTAPIGEGIGPTCTGNDQFCDAGSNSWLLAKIDYELSGSIGETDLFFQIGDAGISQAGQTTGDANVRFGDMTDVLKNGEMDRNLNSNHRDGRVKVHPNLVQVAGFDAADFDTDHDVDGRDFLIWQRGFGVGTTKSQGNATATNDTLVDAVDLAAWQFQYGSVTPPLSGLENVNIPEPASGALAASLLLCVLAGRHRAAQVRHQKSRRAN